MFTVFYQEQHISTYFKVDEAIRLERDGFGRVPQVSCALVGQDGRVFASGNAFLSPTDDFDLAYGMELALARALKKLTQEREVRAKFWKGFHAAVEQTEQDSADLEAALEALEEEQSELLSLAEVLQSFEETPTESPELVDLRKTLAAAERAHSENRGWTEDCGICNAMRERIAALEGR